MKNVLVTGGCGFLGSNFLNEMVVRYPGIHFHNLDKLDYAGSKDNITVQNYPNYHFYHCDINDRSFVLFIMDRFRIDGVVHLAAQTHVDNSFDHSLQYTKDNVLGTHTLLDCAKEYGKIQLFLHMSTDEVYGEVDSEHPGCPEKYVLNPTNPYAATKAAAEMLVNSYYHSYQLPLIIIRCNNMYGKNQYPEKIIPKFINHLLDGKRLPIHGTGITRRNFIHVLDVVDALDIILQKGVLGEVYNIGTNNEYTVLEIAQLLVNLFGKDVTNDLQGYVVFIQDRPFNDFRYSVNSDKISELGWKQTRINFERELENLIQEEIKKRARVQERNVGET